MFEDLDSLHVVERKAENARNSSINIHNLGSILGFSSEDIAFIDRQSETISKLISLVESKVMDGYQVV